MIDREQISEALAGLDAKDREILDYSLRRRVPDADLATIFACTESEVARRRAGAIELLSGRLGVERGADLGHMLKALLDAETWEGVGPLPEAPAAVAQPVDVSAAGHRPLGAMDSPGSQAPPPAVDPERADAASSDPHAPVLGMLSGSAGAGVPDHRRGKAGRRVLVGVAAAVAVLVPAGAVALATRDQGNAEQASDASSVGTFKPQADQVAEPFPSDPQTAGQYPTAKVVRRTAIYAEPDGKVRLRISPKTEWDSPRILSVVERRGRWIAVLIPELKNGERAWVRDDRVGEVSAVTWSVTADLSKRRILVRHNGQTVRTVRIGIGRSDHPTPLGRYAVTDKLRVTEPGSPYGCCVLALTGHQTKLPAGWPGGDRLAVHATRDVSGLGRAVSLGCMRTDPKDTRWMLDRIPLGTPVFVRA